MSGSSSKAQKDLRRRESFAAAASAVSKQKKTHPPSFKAVVHATIFAGSSASKAAAKEGEDGGEVGHLDTIVEASEHEGGGGSPLDAKSESHLPRPTGSRRHLSPSRRAVGATIATAATRRAAMRRGAARRFDLSSVEGEGEDLSRMSLDSLHVERRLIAANLLRDDEGAGVGGERNRNENRLRRIDEELAARRLGAPPALTRGRSAASLAPPAHRRRPTLDLEEGGRDSGSREFSGDAESEETESTVTTSHDGEHGYIPHPKSQRLILSDSDLTDELAEYGRPAEVNEEAIVDEVVRNVASIDPRSHRELRSTRDRFFARQEELRREIDRSRVGELLERDVVEDATNPCRPGDIAASTRESRVLLGEGKLDFFEARDKLMLAINPQSMEIIVIINAANFNILNTYAEFNRFLKESAKRDSSGRGGIGCCGGRAFEGEPGISFETFLMYYYLEGLETEGSIPYASLLRGFAENKSERYIDPSVSVTTQVKDEIMRHMKVILSGPIVPAKDDKKIDLSGIEIGHLLITGDIVNVDFSESRFGRVSFDKGTLSQVSFDRSIIGTGAFYGRNSAVEFREGVTFTDVTTLIGIGFFSITQYGRGFAFGRGAIIWSAGITNIESYVGRNHSSKEIAGREAEEFIIKTLGSSDVYQARSPLTKLIVEGEDPLTGGYGYEVEKFDESTRGRYLAATTQRVDRPDEDPIREMRSAVNCLDEIQAIGAYGESIVRRYSRSGSLLERELSGEEKEDAPSGVVLARGTSHPKKRRDQGSLLTEFVSMYSPRRTAQPGARESFSFGPSASGFAKEEQTLGREASAATTSSGLSAEATASKTMRRAGSFTDQVAGIFSPIREMQSVHGLSSLGPSASDGGAAGLSGVFPMREGVTMSAMLDSPQKRIRYFSKKLKDSDLRVFAHIEDERILVVSLTNSKILALYSELRNMDHNASLKATILGDYSTYGVSEEDITQARKKFSDFVDYIITTNNVFKNIAEELKDHGICFDREKKQVVIEKYHTIISLSELDGLSYGENLDVPVALDLGGADLSYCDLRDVIIDGSKVKLSGCNFGGANLGGVKLTNVNLSDFIIDEKTIRLTQISDRDREERNITGRWFVRPAIGIEPYTGKRARNTNIQHYLLIINDDKLEVVSLSSPTRVAMEDVKHGTTAVASLAGAAVGAASMTIVSPLTAAVAGAAASFATEFGLRYVLKGEEIRETPSELGRLIAQYGKLEQDYIRTFYHYIDQGMNYFYQGTVRRSPLVMNWPETLAFVNSEIKKGNFNPQLPIERSLEQERIGENIIATSLATGIGAAIALSGNSTLIKSVATGLLSYFVTRGVLSSSRYASQQAQGTYDTRNPFGDFLRYIGIVWGEIFAFDFARGLVSVLIANNLITDRAVKAAFSADGAVRVAAAADRAFQNGRELRLHPRDNEQKLIASISYLERNRVKAIAFYSIALAFVGGAIGLGLCGWAFGFMFSAQNLFFSAFVTSPFSLGFSVWQYKNINKLVAPLVSAAQDLRSRLSFTFSRESRDQFIMRVAGELYAKQKRITLEMMRGQLKSLAERARLEGSGFEVAPVFFETLKAFKKAFKPSELNEDEKVNIQNMISQMIDVRGSKRNSRRDRYGRMASKSRSGQEEVPSFGSVAYDTMSFVERRVNEGISLLRDGFDQKRQVAGGYLYSKLEGAGRTVFSESWGDWMFGRQQPPTPSSPPPSMAREGYERHEEFMDLRRTVAPGDAKPRFVKVTDGGIVEDPMRGSPGRKSQFLGRRYVVEGGYNYRDVPIPQPFGVYEQVAGGAIRREVGEDEGEERGVDAEEIKVSGITLESMMPRDDGFMDPEAVSPLSAEEQNRKWQQSVEKAKIIFRREYDDYEDAGEEIVGINTEQAKHILEQERIRLLAFGEDDDEIRSILEMVDVLDSSGPRFRPRRDESLVVREEDEEVSSSVEEEDDRSQAAAAQVAVENEEERGEGHLVTGGEERRVFAVFGRDETESPSGSESSATPPMPSLDASEVRGASRDDDKVGHAAKELVRREDRTRFRSDSSSQEGVEEAGNCVTM